MRYLAVLGVVVLGPLSAACGTEPQGTSGGGSGGGGGGAVAGAGTNGGAGGTASAGAAGASSGGALASGGGGGGGGGAPGPGIDQNGCWFSGGVLKDLATNPMPLGPDGPVVIAWADRYIRAVEGAPGKLYVLDEEAISVINSGELTPTPVVTGLDAVVASNKPDADGMLRVTASHLYWATTTGVARAPLAGGAPEVVYDGITMGHATGVGAPDFLEIGGDYAYFSVREDDTVWRVPVAGGTAELLSDMVSPQGFALDETFVYVADFTTSSVVRFPLAGGAHESIAGGADTFLEGLAVAAGSLYWLDGGVLKFSSLAMPSVVAGSKGVGGSNLLVSGGRVFWQGDGVGWVARDSEACGVLARGAFPDDADDFGFDGTYAYIAFDAFEPKIARVPVQDP